MDVQPTKEQMQELLREARKPLTPLELEIKAQNTVNDARQHNINVIAQEIAKKQREGMNQIIVGMVQDKRLPRWILDKGRQREAAEWLSENGYFWRQVQGDPLNIYFMHRDRAVGHVKINFPLGGSFGTDDATTEERN